MSDAFSIEVPLDSSVGQISEGIHRVTCVAVKKERNKKNTGDNLILDFEALTPGEEGRRIRLYQSLLPQVAFKYQQVFAAFGIDMANKEKARITDQSFLKKTVRVQVVHKDEEGTIRVNIETVLPDDAPARPRTTEAVASLDDEPTTTDQVAAQIDAAAEEALPL